MSLSPNLLKEKRYDLCRELEEELQGLNEAEIARRSIKNTPIIITLVAVKVQTLEPYTVCVEGDQSRSRGPKMCIADKRVQILVG